MNSNDTIKNDFKFFQNEVLRDVKNIESKLSDKIFQINGIISQQNIKIENKINELTSKIIMLSNQIQEKKNNDNIDLILQPIKQKIEDNYSKLDIKINLLEKDYGNSCYKYDKAISNNLTIPGLIGSSCPYETLRPYLEYINIKITELLKAKDKQSFDSKRYKEKLETIINNNKTQFETAQKKINEYCKKGFKQCDDNCIERVNVIEKRIEALRLENGQFSYELKQKTDELKLEWEKLDNFEKDLNKRYDEELEKYKTIAENIAKKVDKDKNDYNLIKLRFTELSDFIKDVRFRRNIHNSVNAFEERRQFKDMSNKIDFTKKQKIKKGEGDINEDKDKTNDILAPFDYYAHFGIDQSFKEEDQNLENENNNRDDNNQNINLDEIKESDEIKINENDIKNSQSFNRKDSKYKTHISNEKSLNLINNNYESELKNNFIVYNNSTNNINKKDNNNNQRKIINIKLKNNNNINNINDIKISNNIEKGKIIPPDYKEATKINQVVLGAKFKKNKNEQKNVKPNLSQAYILMKKKTEEMQRIKSIYGGKPDLRYNQISSPPSLQQTLKHSRNNNNNLNQMNILSNKDFKKGNIEDLYYSQLRKDKFNQIFIAPNTNIRSSSQDNIFSNNTLDRRMLPAINENQKNFDKNNMFMSYFNDSNRHYLNNNYNN